MFEKGSRVTRKASLRVGTVELVSERGCIVQWDYPRLSSLNPYRVEEKVWIPLQYIQFSSLQAEEHSRQMLDKRNRLAKPNSCADCGGVDLEYIDCHHQSHDGTPYVYVWRCKSCRHFVVTSE